MRESKLSMGHILNVRLWEVLQRALRKDEKLLIAL
jgi:hypothetical protein